MIWIFCVQLSLWTYKPGEGKGKGSTDQSELRLGSFWPHPQPIISFLPPFSHSPDAILQFTHKLTVKLPTITDARMVFLKAWIYLDINIHLDLKEKWSSIQFFWWQLFNCQDKTSGKKPGKCSFHDICHSLKAKRKIHEVLGSGNNKNVRPKLNR